MSVDTRNVLVSEVIVGVEDVQDTPPQFIAISNFVEIPGSINKVCKYETRKPSSIAIRFSLFPF